MRNRVIHLHPAAASDEGALEVIQIELAGKAIAFGQPFEADENWLRELRIKFRNASSKPIAYFDFGGGLIRGIDEEPRISESYQQGISWNFGERSDPERGREKEKRILLQPGEVVELTYENVAPYYKGATQTERGAFCKLVLGTTLIQFEDGTIDPNGTIKLVPGERVQAVSLCSLQQHIDDGNHQAVRVTGVFSNGLQLGTLADATCPKEITWVELDLRSERNKDKLRKLLDRSRRAYVVVEGEFYGPPLPDPHLPEAIRRSYHPGWGHLAAFRTKLVVHAILDVKADSTNGTSPETRKDRK